MRHRDSVSQSLINNLIDNLEGFVLAIDVDGNVRASSPFAKRILGCAASSPVWMWPEWGDAGSNWQQACAAALQGTRESLVVSVDTSSIKKSHVQFSLSPVKNDTGEILFLLAETRDVPPLDPQSLLAEQQANDWLLNTESRFKLMVENIDDYAMFMVDLDGFITSWNRGAERLTGYADDEAIGRHFSMLYPKEFLDKDHAVHELMMAQIHGRYEEEGVRVRKNGTRYHAQVIVWPVEDKSGQIVSFAKITRDITALKAAERALKDSEAKFRTMTDAMPQMVWSALPNGKQDYINKQWFHFTGAEPHEGLDQTWLNLVHSDDINFVRNAWNKSLSIGDDFEAQFRLRHCSGIYRWALGRALAVRDEQDNITRWLGTLTDIHEQKRAETSLYNSTRRKDEYLAMLAHELRNPLAPIRNSTELLRRLINSKEALMGIDVIDRQVAHMTRLIDDLLDVARISRGKIELRRETFEFGELIRQAANDFHAAFEHKQVRLQVDIPDDPLWLFADPTRISQALGNLLHNALKFTEPNGEVRIALREDIRDGKSFAAVSVSDNGAGIHPELLEQLFEPFVQGDQDLARSKGGLGLGLALIKGFASLHGGTVQAHSAGVGCGSEFIFRVPLATNTARDIKPTTASVAVSPLSIVLIDDNRDMVDTLATLLAMDGHKVQSAFDGESGLALIKTTHPDLVFCDIGLPGGYDGYTIARCVREDTSMDNTFLVALSGYGQDKDKKMALASGFNEHMLKPIDFKGLLKMISAAQQFSPACSPG